MLSLVLKSCLGFTITPCLNEPPLHDTYANLSTREWNGSVMGFCEGLFFANDTIYPIQEISCDGEFGNFTVVRRGIGALSPKCRLATATFMCLLFLPKTRAGLIPLALPCTSEQADTLNPYPTTVTSWITEQCGATAMKYMSDFGLDKAFTTVDNLLDLSVGVRSACRVVDRGDMEREEDMHREWFPELWDCPTELVKKDKSDINDFTNDNPNNIGCVPPCHGFVRKKSNQKIIENALKYENSFSAVALFIVIVKWIYSRKQFSFPVVIPLYVIGSILCMHVVLGMGIFKPHYEGIWCENEYTVASFDHAQCSVQGGFILFFGLSGSLWWFWLVFCMHQTVVFEKSVDEVRRYVWLAHITSWGIPSASLIIAAATRNIFYASESFACFISSNDNGLWQYLLFFLVIFVVLALGIMLSLSVVIHLKKKYKMRATTGYSLVAALEMKTVCLIVVVFIIQVMLIILRIDGSARDFKASLLTAYIECLFSTFILDVSNTTCEKPVFHDTIPILVSIVLSIQGFLAGVGLLSDFKRFGKIKRSANVPPIPATNDQSNTRTISIRSQSRTFSNPIALFSKKQLTTDCIKL